MSLCNAGSFFFIIVVEVDFFCDVCYTCVRQTERMIAMEAYQYITLRERPEWREKAAQWFHEKWGVPKEAYLACMDRWTVI